MIVTSWLQKYKHEIMIGLLFLFILGVFFYFQFRDYQFMEMESDSVFDVVQKEDNKKTNFMIDVKGAVAKAGIYEVGDDGCILDAIQMAGGLTDEADTSMINLSKKLEDGMMIVIPTKEEVELENSVVILGENGSDLNEGKLSINKASVSELETLPGIGLKKASDIVAYREEHGGFQSLDELMNVKGIGSSIYEKLKSYIML